MWVIEPETVPETEEQRAEREERQRQEARPEQDQVVSHVIIKADVRGSTKMTQDLLARGLSPASHFSLNLHEPVKRLLDRFNAKKVFHRGRRHRAGHI